MTRRVQRVGILSKGLLVAALLALATPEAQGSPSSCGRPAGVCTCGQVEPGHGPVLNPAGVATVAGSGSILVSAPSSGQWRVTPTGAGITLNFVPGSPA